MLPSTEQVSKENLGKVLYQRAKGSYKRSEVPSGKKRRLKGYGEGRGNQSPEGKAAGKGHGSRLCCQPSDTASP